jgi:hypothetical protein
VSWLPDYRHWAARSTYLSDYLPILYGTAARYTDPVIAEIGTDRGESTVSLLAGAEISGGHVWSIDINEHVPFLEVAARHDEADRKLWTFVTGDSTGLVAARSVPGAIDVLFIDGEHTYERVVAELKLYLPRMAGGGTVLLHDTHDAPFVDRRLVQVGAALDDTLPGMGLRWDDYPGVCGLGVIKMPVTVPCYFCHAQARGRWTPETESQIGMAGNGPVDVCDGCAITAAAI